MAAPVLTPEQRDKLLTWVIAGFPAPLIHSLFRAHGWQEIEPGSIQHYRNKHRDQIEARFKERMDAAWDAGLAQREARVRALVDHAAKLEEIMWLPDDKGKLHNEKAWRETLDDIAKELGHRRAGVDVNVSNLTDSQLAAEAEGYLRALRPAAAGEDGSDESG